MREFSPASAKGLAFVAANAATGFRSLLTLTYHAVGDEWVSDEARNLAVVKRSKTDLNRFLSAMRGELGAYLWVQEFQARGVIHYHLLCQGLPSPERVGLVWCRATGELDDAAALRHAAKVESVTSERAARGYVGRYLGKARQKVLPPGVAGAGRWWGRSRSLQLVLLEEVVAGEAGLARAIPEGVRIVRCLRRYVSKVFKRKFRSGQFLDWGGELAARLQALAVRLKEYFGRPRRLDELLEEFGWEPAKFEGRPVEVLAQKRRREALASEGQGMDEGWESDEEGWR